MPFLMGINCTKMLLGRVSFLQLQVSDAEATTENDFPRLPAPLELKSVMRNLARVKPRQERYQSFREEASSLIFL